MLPDRTGLVRGGILTNRNGRVEANVYLFGFWENYCGEWIFNSQHSLVSKTTLSFDKFREFINENFQLIATGTCRGAPGRSLPINYFFPGSSFPGNARTRGPSCRPGHLFPGL